jgi:hypothetical protein
MIISWLVELCLIQLEDNTYFWRPYLVWLTTKIQSILFAKALNFGEDFSMALISVVRAGFTLIDGPAINIVASAKDVQLIGAVVVGSMAFWELIHQETDGSALFKRKFLLYVSSLHRIIVLLIPQHTSTKYCSCERHGFGH